MPPFVLCCLGARTLLRGLPLRNNEHKADDSSRSDARGARGLIFNTRQPEEMSQGYYQKCTAPGICRRESYTAASPDAL